MNNGKMRNFGLDSIRVALMDIVVIHHSLLAYVASGKGAQSMLNLILYGLEVLQCILITSSCVHSS